MPEGDTVYKIARFMKPLLEGKKIVSAAAGHTRLPLLEGCTVQHVRAAGKHLLVHLDAWILRVHLGLHGDWHRYAPGETWRRSRGQASVLLTTEQDVFVCFNAKDVDCLRPQELAGSVIGALGPDLLSQTCDLAAVVQQARRCHPETVLADLLLDQRVAAGIGNVYKSEILFMHQQHPLSTCEAIEDTALHLLYETARRLLQSNLGGWRRTTTHDAREGGLRSGGRLYVYGRKGDPCSRCGGAISKRLLGQTRRVTYWCPVCQICCTSMLTR